ncbi:Repeat domain-containing protein [Halorubrum aquaticum]|uniref:Repeat domain-containing protein n=1 Tax=Halorubrum aquaticum TaxID=387340 RepID=A0A1I2Z5Y6_9EURY|nr:CRTAC1 family protein [Halorubrum aquaticum]SFH33120.1 Repeat domain-containing protein [Halorubrum aquaticum]
MFADRSDLLADADPVRGYGVAVTPGRDGPLVFVAGYGKPNRLYARENGGSGRFADTACGIVADGDRHAMGVCAADVDADGCEEIYVHNCANSVGVAGDSDLLLDRLEADRYRWTDAFALPVNADRLNFRAGRSVAALDRLGTGRYGVAVASYGAPLAFYELGDDGEASDMADAVGLAVEDGCRSLLPGPLCSAGTDLFVGVESGPNRLFRNDGGHYEAVDGGPDLADPAGDARGVALVDEDGSFALAVGNWEGHSRLLRPDSSGRYRDVAPSELRAAEGVRSVVAADFDNDGRQELFCNGFGETNRLFERVDPAENAGSAEPRWAPTETGAAAEPRGFGTGAVAADVDGDGILELVVVHGEVAAQPISVYAAPEAAENDWLRVRPTTPQGAPARGAIVRLHVAGGGTQRRVIDAGGGYLCQTEPVAHFGVGDAEPLRAVVRWPDGRERTIVDPEPNVELDVAHPTVVGE